MNIIKKKFFGLGLIILSMTLSLFLIPIFQISNNSNQNNNVNIKSSQASHYSIDNSVTYDITINYTLTSTALGTFNLKWSMLDNRTPSSSLTPDCPPYQESDLLYNSITSNTFNPISFDITPRYADKFNNTFQNITVTLASGQYLKINQHYQVTANAISFSGISPGDIGAYPTPPNELYDLFNVTEPFFNCSDPNLITLSNYLVSPSDDVITKAQKIIQGVVNELFYIGQSSEIGASEAVKTGIGDCSEYADLMVTLLRIQNIPARKVVGFVVTNYASTLPLAGNTWILEYSDTNSINALNAHAWIEYFVPNIGWIVCDPTWQEGYNYFNRIDCLHIAENIGAYFSIPAPPYTASELGIPQMFASSNVDFRMEIRVIASDYVPFNWILVIIIICIIGVVVVVAVIVIRSKIKKRKYESTW